jgi:serine/threonine-protein kinase
MESITEPPGPPPAAPGELRPGVIVGDYQIQQVIGRGGMGTVYRAVHPVIGSAVAIKVLRRDGPVYSAEAAERFLAEARLASQLRHPNIVQVFSFGRLDDGGLYYVMELLDGLSLKQLLKRKGRLELSQALPILKAVASALDAAHARSVVHRDIKPANIFLVRPELELVPPQVKLLDFGIAKLLSPVRGDDPTMTAPGQGTPAYMTPEQCRGRGIDHRTDIYALGLVAYELLSGTRAYRADSPAELLLKQTAGPPPSLAGTHPDLPEATDASLRRALDISPERRFQSAADLVADLAAAAELPSSSIDLEITAPLESDRTPTPRQGTASLPPRPQRPRRLAVILLAVAAAGLLAMGYYLLGRTASTADPGPTDAAPALGARATDPPAGAGDARTAEHAPGSREERRKRRRRWKRRRAAPRRSKKKEKTEVVRDLPVRF